MQQTQAVETKPARRKAAPKKAAPPTDQTVVEGERNKKLAAIKKRLAELHAKHGNITPEMVVTDARDPRSPLHARFDWDDSTAAEAYRIIQARVLIKTIRYETRIVHTPPMRIPSYVRDPKLAGRVQGYIAVPRTEKEAARDFLVDELDRAMGLLRRAQAYAEDTNQKAVSKALSAAIALIEPFIAKETK
jgi:hypothetical protein